MKKILIALGIFLVIAIIVIGNAEDDSSITSSSSSTTSAPVSKVWSVCDFKDEFGLPTGEKYLKATATGTFNGVLGKNQDLKVEIQASENDVFIVLWEYGYSQVDALLERDQYRVTVLDQNNEKHKFYAFIREGKAYLDFDNYRLLDYKSAEDLVEILKTPGTVSFYVVQTSDEDNSYSFSVKTDGFAQLYEQILPKEEVVE